MVFQQYKRSDNIKLPKKNMIIKPFMFFKIVKLHKQRKEQNEQK